MLVFALSVINQVNQSVILINREKTPTRFYPSNTCIQNINLQDCVKQETSTLSRRHLMWLTSRRPGKFLVSV